MSPASGVRLSDSRLPASRPDPPRWAAGVAIERALHPARVIGALIATGAVAAAAALVTVCAHATGIRGPVLPALLGGLAALNAVLFLPQGTLAGHPKRTCALLVVSIVPMPVAVLLFQVAPPLAGAAVVITAAAAMLARASGSLAAALALLTALNLLTPLVIGVRPVLYVLTPLAGLIGTASAVAADHLQAWFDRRLTAAAERTLLADAAATFLQDLACSLRDPGAPPTAWRGEDEARVRRVMADMALARPPGQLGPASTADQFLAGIAGCAAGLAGDGSAAPSPLLRDARAAIDGVAQALRAGSTADGVRCAATLIDLAGRSLAKGDVDAAPEALGLAVLLRDFVHAVLDPIDPAVPTVVNAGPIRPGTPEIRLAVQVAASLALAIVAANLMIGPKPYWIVLSAFFVSCATFGESLLKSLERALGTVAGLLVGQLAWLTLGSAPGVMICVLTLAVFGIFFSRAGPYRWTLFWLTVALAALLHLSDVRDTFYLARFGDTLIGAAIALAVGRLLLPMRTADAARAKRELYLACIARQLRGLAAAPGGRRTATDLDGPTQAALASLHTMAGAEMIEGVMSRAARLAVRRRLVLADRLARSTIALGATVELLPGGLDPATAGLVVRLAQAAEQQTSPPDREAVRVCGAGLIAGAAGDEQAAERLAALLRVLRLVAVMSEAIEGLSETDGMSPGHAAGGDAGADHGSQRRNEHDGFPA